MSIETYKKLTNISTYTEEITGSPISDLTSSSASIIIDNKNSSLPNEVLRTKKEAKNKARREAETIEHTITKESIEPQQQEQTIRQEKNLIRSKENDDSYPRNDREPFSTNMTLWRYSTGAWIDMYKEFAINAAKLSEYWFINPF